METSGLHSSHGSFGRQHVQPMTSVIARRRPLVVTSSEYFNSSSSLRGLGATCWRTEKVPIDENWPALPSSMSLPALRHTLMNPVAVHADPMAWILGKFVDAITI